MPFRGHQNRRVTRRQQAWRASFLALLVGGAIALPFVEIPVGAGLPTGVPNAAAALGWETGVPNAAAALGWETGVPNAAAALGWETGQSSPTRREAVPPPRSSAPAPSLNAVLDQYCIACHNQKLRTGGIALDSLDVNKPGAEAETWERVIAKLRAGSMPPAGRPRPDPATYHAVASAMEKEIDRAWAARPNPGRTSAVHRLNRTEYNNAVRDLFGLEIDVKSLLPGDDTADGSFDNFADVLTISTAHLERYLSVARQVTRLATGLPPASPGLQTYEIPLHVLQDDRQSDDLPFGTRGGLAVRHNFPVDGEYHIKVRLRRQYQDYLMGMGWPQQLDVRLDGKLLKRFTVGGGAKGRPAAASYAGDGEPGFAGDPEWETYMQTGGDAGLEIRIPVEAGPRMVAVYFVRELWEPEGLPQPVQRGRVLTNDQIYMDYASVGSVTIGGPSGPQYRPRTRRAAAEYIVCQPRLASEEKACATKILSRIARLAYRRPVTNPDVQTLLEFFDHGRRDGGSFDAGIQFALERMLVDPDFLLRVHRDPQKRSGVPPSLASGRRASFGAQAASALSHQPSAIPGSAISHQPSVAHRLSDLELASRLSFFLWSSIPDERLLDLAERGELTRPLVLEQQVRRMLADRRAIGALVDDFAAQWLNLRRVDEVVVHPDRIPASTRACWKRSNGKPSCLSRSTLREDRSVLDLLRANYTFVNERLARHYGFPASTAAGSAASRCRTPISAADCSRTARCWRRRRIPIGHRRCCAASGC